MTEGQNPEQEQLNYRPLSAWESMSLSELEAAYGLIPTERQQYYREVLAREAGKAQAASDAQELQVVVALLERFSQDALVPVGARWAKPPTRVKSAAMVGERLISPEEVYNPSGGNKPNPIFILVAVGLILACGLLFILTTRSGEDGELAVETALFGSPTPRYTVTPTPIALEQQDTIIKDGDWDNSRSLAYPVGLQIYPQGEQQPRVFVVQRRAVGFSEWDYDPNPDAASYLLGMSVRRVVGIPWSAENDALFARLQEGSVFHLILNTGAVIEYEFAQKSQVRRSDTAAFRQISPGLVLVLIGELDRSGAPTATRSLVLARYDPSQEVARAGVLNHDAQASENSSPTPLPATPSGTPVPARTWLHVELITAGVSPEGYLQTRLRLYNRATEALTIQPADLQLALGYQPQLPGPWLTAEGLALELLPEQALDLSLFWPWEGQSHALLQVLDYRFGLDLPH